jgi:hypothetical protein
MINQFVLAAGCSHDQAKQLLAAANNDFQVSMIYQFEVTMTIIHTAIAAATAESLPRGTRAPDNGQVYFRHPALCPGSQWG